MFYVAGFSPLSYFFFLGSPGLFVCLSSSLLLLYFMLPFFVSLLVSHLIQGLALGDKVSQLASLIGVN